LTTYKLRDWLISRQRYWGTPIPIVYDPEGNAHPVKEEHLPWLLPTDVEFKPTGESPLKYSKEFIERTERLYGKGWRPEFDTMDTFVDSSWYYLRYVSARDGKVFADKEQIKAWLPVDFYMIGPEHIVLHLLYSRFFTKFLRDQGYLSFDEPFLKMRHQGMILGPDGKKMSKSKGNVISPDEIIEKFGADTLRVYEMFMGPIEADKPWDIRAVAGIYRFLSRFYRLVEDGIGQLSQGAEVNQADQPTKLQQSLHRTLKKISSDIPQLKFNTSIAAMMELVNDWSSSDLKKSTITFNDLEIAIKMIAPFAPFLSEELYSDLSSTKQSASESVHLSDWPAWSEKFVKSQTMLIPIQVNGKVRSSIEILTDDLANQSVILEQAIANDKIKRWTADKEIIKQIYIPGKIVNLVVK